MNTRLLYVVLLVQLCFAGALLFVGRRARENRKWDYVELTHRATAGHASFADFEKLAGYLPEKAEKTEVRILFGLPVLRTDRVELADGEKRETLTGEIWLYYPPRTSPTPETQPMALDSTDAAKLSGPVPCFVVAFDARGRASVRKAIVVHPVSK